MKTDRWVIRSRSGRVVAAMPDGALYFEQTYWPFFDDEENIDDLPGAFAESMWTTIAAPPGPVTRRTAARRSPPTPRKHRPGHHRPVRRQPAGMRPVPLPQRRLPHAAGRKPAARACVPRPAGGTAPEKPGTVPAAWWATRSTSFCSATTWACSPDRRCRPPCTASSSSRATS